MADPRSLLSKADKMASSASGGFSFFGGKTDKLEQAADLYSQAGNAFRIANLGNEAGASFEKAAEIQRRLEEPDDAANSMTEAFKSYKRSSPEDAARCLDQAIQHYAVKGNLRRAATHKQNLAELYEVTIGDPARAAKTYDEAGNWFLNDNAEALANKCFLKVAELAAIQELNDYQVYLDMVKQKKQDVDPNRYPKFLLSIGKYEDAARMSMTNAMLKWGVKELLFKAGICLLANGDLVAMEKKIVGVINTEGIQTVPSTYELIDSTFPDQRECALLRDLLTSLKSGDKELWEQKAGQYDQMSRLDPWKVKLLLFAKAPLDREEDMT